MASSTSRDSSGASARSFQVLDGTMLKMIAMVSMVFDHVGDNFFPDQTWMRVIGRIAMPIFAFCIAEGFSHTHDRLSYLKRMGVFALVSEVPFDLVTAGSILEFSHQNIMATFFWAILGLVAFEKVTEGGTSRRHAGVGVLVAFIVGSLALRLDYNMLAVGLIYIFYLLRGRDLLLRTAVAAAYHALLRNVGVYWFGLLGFVPIIFYNGKRGAGLKWLFYVFYPGHLLLIWLVKTMMG